VRSKTVDPKRHAFEGAIIVLVIGLSHHHDGHWLAVQDIRALLVTGGIDNELTDERVMFAVRSRNDARLVDGRHGRKATRCCKDMIIISCHGQSSSAWFGLSFVVFVILPFPLLSSPLLSSLVRREVRDLSAEEDAVLCLAARPRVVVSAATKLP
jgi:hypothetical protein